MISYQTDGVEMPSIKKRETTEWIKSVAATYGKRVGEIAYIFCSDEKILEVNRQYLQHDYYTDIITFDYCEGTRHSCSPCNPEGCFSPVLCSNSLLDCRVSNCTGSSSTASSTFAASMTKGRENGRLWRRRKIRRWRCGKSKE